MTPGTIETAAVKDPDDKSEETEEMPPGNTALKSLPLFLQAAVARRLTGQDNGITLEQALLCIARPAPKPSRPSPSEVKIPRHLEMSGMTREQALECMGY